MTSRGISQFLFLCGILLLQVQYSLGSGCSVNKTEFNLEFTSEIRINNTWFHPCLTVEHVNLSNNAIRSVENNSFEYLWNVHTLDLSNNVISVIEPDAFAIMRILQNLYVDHNELEEIPVGFFNNKNYLKIVDLSFNKITHIPLPVLNFSIERIEKVLLHNNLLTAFEPWAYFRQSIGLFDVRYNNISTFTNEYNWTYMSRTVYNKAATDLRNNSISKWHDWYLLQYKEPSAENVRIEAVLVELLTDIRENPFICDCDTYNLIKKVRQSFFLWTNSEYLSVTCYNPPNLRGKRAFYDVALNELVCNISKNCPSGCLCQDRPDKGILNIDCRDLNMTQIPKIVPESPYDKIEIQLGGNDITSIQNVTYLQHITKLSMPGNSLTALPDFVIDEIARKENAFVDFRNNSLTMIPSGIQNIKFQDALFSGNDLQCTCDMLWMVDWIKLAPRNAEKSLSCTFEGELYTIMDLNEDILNCHDVGSIILIVVLTIALVIVIALLITAKRCPYETKVILFKIFRIHPSDKYQVDDNTDKSYDMYVSFDDNDPYVRQWVLKVLFKQLEGKKPCYKLSVAIRNAPPGPEADARLQLIEESRRLLIILSKDYEKHQWCEYEMCHSETLEQNEGRIIYLLYDKNAEEYATREPWLSKMKGRKVFNVQERILWAKLRYELPTKRLPARKAGKEKEAYLKV